MKVPCRQCQGEVVDRKKKSLVENIQCENYFNIYCDVMAALIKSESSICFYYWRKI